MDRMTLKNKLEALIKKYKYVVIVILAGILLMALPTRKYQNSVTPTPQATSAEMDVEDKLCSILREINGAGELEVMLTQAAGEKILYQMDEDIQGSGGDRRAETVLITDADRKQEGLITQVRGPEYLGAVIVCQGAKDAKVRLAIVEAVTKATGLGADKIAVLEMK